MTALIWPDCSRVASLNHEKLGAAAAIMPQLFCLDKHADVCQSQTPPIISLSLAARVLRQSYLPAPNNRVTYRPLSLNPQTHPHTYILVVYHTGCLETLFRSLRLNPPQV